LYCRLNSVHYMATVVTSYTRHVCHKWSERYQYENLLFNSHYIYIEYWYGY
jgi:hypothetical protein